MRKVYADNAATTQLSKTALDVMMPYLTESYGNPSGAYGVGRDAKKALENARETVAHCLGASTNEIYFTGCGSEADNWAIKGTALAKSSIGRHIITSAIEHHAITHTLAYLEKYGYEVTYLPVDRNGQVSVDDLRSAIRDDTILVSIMLANNEIGTVLNIKELAAAAKERDVWFHTDAVQAVGHIPIDVKELGVDMLSLSGHKFRGPKGVGAMYIRKGIDLPPLIHGGGQERNRRSGTENVAGIAGMAAALKEATDNMNENVKKVTAMRDRLVSAFAAIPYSRLTGDPVNRLPGTASFVFEYVEGESLVLNLDNAGICVSSGSACTSASLDPSHILLAIGLSRETARGSLRISINECTTDEDVDYIIETLPAVIDKLRKMSPAWKNKLNEA